MKKYIFFIYLALISCTQPVFAEDKVKEYESMTGLTGLDKIGNDAGSFGEFVNFLVQWSIGLAAALAVITIMIGGLERMTHDSIQKQSDGRKRIEAAIWGLLIALSSYLLLATINPKLLNLDINIEDVIVQVKDFETIDEAKKFIRGSSNQGKATSTPNRPTTTPTTSTVQPTNFPNPAWNQCAVNAINQSQLPNLRPQDTANFFPSTTGNPTSQDWANLLAGMASKESGFRPELTYKESFKDRNGNNVISTGLLQVSQESSRNYGFKNITTEQLKDPCQNIEVGVKILEKWVAQDGCISCKSADGNWRGGARYWSVLRK